MPDNLTHTFSPGAALNTALNPLARLSGKYYVPEFMSRFPTKADPYFNASLFQAGALGGTYLALAGLTRYVMGMSELERKKADADKQVKDRLGVEEEAVDIHTDKPATLEKSAGSMGDFMSFAIPMAALAVGVSGGYAIASRKLNKDRGAELDKDLAETENKLTKTRSEVMARNTAPAMQKSAMGPGSALIALAGLGLASIYATSAILSKKQFDSGDEARQNQKATDAAFKSLTRSRLAASDTDLHLVERERALKRLAKPRELAGPEAPKLLPEAPASAPQEIVRPYEAVPV
jgi:hypothetical protein